MNRFKIISGKEETFEEIWKSRDTHLENVPGFKKFNLIKGSKKENYRLYDFESSKRCKIHKEKLRRSRFSDGIFYHIFIKNIFFMKC